MKAILVLDNVRSAHNVGALWRTAAAIGCQEIWLCGITPHPPEPNDKRLPHIAERDQRQIAKTALGAEMAVNWRYFETNRRAIKTAQTKKAAICALEITETATSLFDFKPDFPLILTVGHETEGVSQEWLQAADVQVAIPMPGKKESLNVAAAGAIALYWLLYRATRPS